MSKVISNLLTVKSIVTILLTLVFCYAVIASKVSGGDFLTIFTVIIAFYFGTQHEKAGSEKNEEESLSEDTE